MGGLFDKVQNQKSPEQLAYEAALVEDGRNLIVRTASTRDDLKQIGGAVVDLLMKTVEDLATATKWTEAKWLYENKTYPYANRVIARSKAVELRRENEGAIKAARRINRKGSPLASKTFGQEIGELWDEGKELEAEADKADIGNMDYAKAKNKYQAAVDKMAVAVAHTAVTDAKVLLRTGRDTNNLDISVCIQSIKNIDEIDENQRAEELQRLQRKLRDCIKLEAKYAKDAEALGIDPNEPSRRENTAVEEAAAEDLFMHYDWFQLKKKLHDPADTDVDVDVMWKLWRYRKKYVNKLIDELRASSSPEGLPLDPLPTPPFPTLIAKASGSNDMESDIDITFAGKNKDDVNAAVVFNAIVFSKFGKPPGRVFDVNIYPRDYNAIRESFNPDFNLEALKDVDISHPTKDSALGKMSNEDQDVATLLKQCRFLDQMSYWAMADEIADEIADREVGPILGNEQNLQEIMEARRKAKAKAMQSYEEGYAIFLLTAVEKINEILKNQTIANQLDQDPDPNDDETLQHLKDQYKLYKTLTGDIEQLRRDSTIAAPPKGVKVDDTEANDDQSETSRQNYMRALVPQFLDLLEEYYEAEVMLATDRLYLERMDKLRDDQDRIEILANEDNINFIEDHKAYHMIIKHPDPPTDPSFAECTHFHPDMDDHNLWRKKILDVVKLRVKKNQFENIVFANEAYMSQGAIEHVVAGIQARNSGDEVEAKKIIDGLTPQTLTQSFNEQLADFFKDMKSAQPDLGVNLSPEEIGEAFVHASKYLVRLLDAAELLAVKINNLAFEFIKEVLQNAGKVRSEDNETANIQLVKKEIEDVLYTLRKSASISAIAKGLVGIDEAQRLFKVETVGDFRDKIAEFGVEFNKKVRSTRDYQQGQEASTQDQLERHGTVRNLEPEIVDELDDTD